MADQTGENSAFPQGLRDDLKRRLAQRLACDGPLTVAAFMAEALYDRQAGYYATKDPIGAERDFITAPEISQMFGELIGLWCVQTWKDLGEPERLHLIELGPGSGALMSDALRAARVAPDFANALRVSLVEISPALQAAQAQKLSNTSTPIDWTDTLPKTGNAPCVIIGNEFIDCLPVRQFIRAQGQWWERLVGLDPNDHDRLAFVLSPLPAPDHICGEFELHEAEDGALIEIRPGVTPLIETVGHRLSAQGGRALFIDYGPAEREFGDTLQAVRRHQKVLPLDTPGEADLTARVDFAALRRAILGNGLEASGPATQGEWLVRLGLEHRAAALIAQSPDQRTRIATQLLRLTDDNEMGTLFKVLCASSVGLPPPAGFEESP